MSGQDQFDSCHSSQTIYIHTVPIIEDYTIASVWSKTSLIRSLVGERGRGGPSYFLKGDIFLTPLALNVAIFNIGHKRIVPDMSLNKVTLTLIAQP